MLVTYISPFFVIIQAAQSLVPLLDTAKQVIPARLWNETPIALKATAGLRLLPGDKSKAILSEVCLSNMLTKTAAQ